jgi:hypothetical protein
VGKFPAEKSLSPHGRVDVARFVPVTEIQVDEAKPGWKEAALNTFCTTGTAAEALGVCHEATITAQVIRIREQDILILTDVPA